MSKGAKATPPGVADQQSKGGEPPKGQLVIRGPRSVDAALTSALKIGDARLVSKVIVSTLVHKGCSKALAIRALAALGYEYKEAPKLVDLYRMVHAALEALRPKLDDGTLGDPPRGMKEFLCSEFAGMWDDMRGTRGNYGAKSFRNAYDAWLRAQRKR